ncbi:DUF7260 family protein [Haladaptatus sp. DFWS20]|uniref:DUF7260 family protein n=1 Tax=Haladaptatus sp. DFWS20 TaxID=3403467 RepID=UPI003EB97435
MARNGEQLIDHTLLPRAERLTNKEESQCQAEIDAFENFLDRLSEIPPHPYQTDGGSLQGSVQTRPQSVHTFPGAVQTAYRETVLSVDHWKDEYGEETVLESIEDEFGPEVAAGLAGGSATWSQLLWNQLQTASETAIETRQRSLMLITEEQKQLEELRSSLAEIGDELAAIERCEYPFAERSDRLAAIQQQLDELTARWQTYLHQRKRSNDKLFSYYIYTDLDTNFPGLAALATSQEILDRITLRHWAGLH